MNTNPDIENAHDKPATGALRVFVAQEHPRYSTALSAPEGTWENYTAPDGKRGIRVDQDALVALGMMRRQ